MSMISELVKELRKYAEEYKNLSWSEVCEKTKRMLNCATDTIEELSLKLHNSQMERSSMYYNGGWIPVEERLPEINANDICSDDVLVIVKHKDGHIQNDVARYCQNGEWGYNLDGDFGDYNVLTWRPLPPVYEKAGD